MAMVENNSNMDSFSVSDRSRRSNRRFRSFVDRVEVLFVLLHIHGHNMVEDNSSMVVFTGQHGGGQLELLSMVIFTGQLSSD